MSRRCIVEVHECSTIVMSERTHQFVEVRPVAEEFSITVFTDDAGRRQRATFGTYAVAIQPAVQVLTCEVRS